MKLLRRDECVWALNASLEDFKPKRGCTPRNPFRRKILQKYDDAKARCCRVSHPLYPYYGGRGLKVEFTKEEFVTWFLIEYRTFVQKNGLHRPSLSRKNYDIGYTVGNIELTTVSENSRELYLRRGNRSPRGTVLDEIKVLVCHTVKDTNLLAKEFGVTYQAVRQIQNGTNRPEIFKILADEGY